MAIAIGSTVYDDETRAKKGLLDIDVETYYFDKMRPFLNEIWLKCKTDEELNRTVEKVINASDSFCSKKDYANLSESFDTLEKAITNPNYFTRAMKNAPEEEKNKVRELIDKISDFKMIIKCEPAPEIPEKKAKDRVGYIAPGINSPIGENEGYDEHNMKKLTEPIQAIRIPNV